MKPNDYFDSMYRAGCEWQKCHDEHRARKDQIIRQYGWDSPEMDDWHKTDEPFPFSQGQHKALMAFRSTAGDELELSDFLWPGEVQDFVDTLRKAGLHSFVFTNSSTAVMENIHHLVAAGCVLEGPCTLTKKSERWGGETEEQVLGLRFRV